ncbi:MAG: hypothetical protein BGO55_20650 [Sphingobacteriales bacterium 50-39]|nr:hypothetical protein [Sphingobacteriales bacterium]OJW59099.1 MAG: hypothetical protein BGO55_20650 [Sphingobacteriales bacterium 50-39]
MNITVRIFRAAFIIGVTVLRQFSCFAQDSTAIKVSSPFESLPVKDVVAKGNSTGMVEIVMTFQNNIPKLADIYLSLGTFNDFGVTDDKGNKYKVFTNEGLIETSPINKGYKKVQSVQLGGKRMQTVTYLKDTLANGHQLPLRISIGKVDKSTQYIKEIHVRCILSLNHVWTGDQGYQVHNIKIAWDK